MTENECVETLECFVIMPISNQTGYDEGHFKSVYNDIFKPAIEKAGFKAYRADDSQSSNVIHLEIIKRLIEAPMAICDLSTKNPNVMYELGIRQAFDKPVLLVGDNNPGDIFDVGNINTYQYRNKLKYREVMQDQEKISKMIKETYDKHSNGSEFNSLISLININSAKINTKNIDENTLIKATYNEIIRMKSDILSLKKKINNTNDFASLNNQSFNKISNKDLDGIVLRVDDCNRRELRNIDKKMIEISQNDIRLNDLNNRSKDCYIIRNTNRNINGKNNK